MLRQMVVVQEAFFSTPGIPIPLFSKRILLISMSRNLALGGDFAQNSSELPREWGGVPWQGCNLTLNNNGSTRCSGTYWQLGWLKWSLDSWVWEAVQDPQLSLACYWNERSWYYNYICIWFLLNSQFSVSHNSLELWKTNTVVSSRSSWRYLSHSLASDIKLHIRVRSNSTKQCDLWGDLF